MPLHIQSSQARIDYYKILFSSLIALGLNPSILEQKEKLVINEHVLKKISQRVGDYLLHFLFVIIDPQHSSKLFRDCWPIYDKKTESQFRNACYDWLKHLCQNNDFNLKPTLVVSKAAVAPTSQKFLSTLQTLIRIALVSSISRQDTDTVLLHLSTLSESPEQRIISMKIILSAKVKHCKRYTSRNYERLKNLKTWQEKSSELVTFYRSLLVQQEESMNIILEKISKSSCIDHETKNKYKNVHSFDGAIFRSEFEATMKEKNEEMKLLWSNLERLQKKDKEVSPFLSSLISGNIGLTSVDGSSYKKNLLLAMDDPVIAKFENLSLYFEEKLDLLSVFKLQRNVLIHLLNKIRQSRAVNKYHAYSRVSEETKRLKKCVTALLKSFNEISSQTSDMYASIFPATNEIRQKLEKYNNFFETKHPDTFDLCPPSPAIYHNSSTESAEISFRNSSFGQLPLTPSGTKSFHFFPKKLCNEVASPNLNQLLLRKNHLQVISTVSTSNNLLIGTQACDNVYGTPINATLLSNHQFTQDSGCILSSENFSESLAQTLEKIDITPKDKAARNFGNDFNSFKTMTESIKFENDILSPFNSSLTLDNTVFNSYNESVNKNLPSNTIDREVNMINDKPQERENNFVLDDLYESGIITPQRTISMKNRPITSSNFINVNEVSKMNDDISQMQHHTSWKSPIVAKLLTELENCSLYKPFNHISKNISKKTKKIPTEKSLTDINKKVLKTTEPVLNNTLMSATSLPKDNDSTDIDKANIQENFSLCMTSLESMLGPEANFDFNTNFTSSKDLFHQEGGLDYATEKFYDISSIDTQYLLNPSVKYLKSNHLPSGSVFETLTESFAAGELEPCSLLNEEIMDEVRRESLLLSRRESILSLGHRSNGQSPRLSEAFQLRSKNNFSNILDESDSCLLSLSTEDF